MRRHSFGRDAALIGDVTNDEQRFVQISTTFSGARFVEARGRVAPPLLKTLIARRSAREV